MQIEPGAAAAVEEMRAALARGDRLDSPTQTSPFLVSIAISLKRIADLLDATLSEEEITDA